MVCVRVWCSYSSLFSITPDISNYLIGVVKILGKERPAGDDVDENGVCEAISMLLASGHMELRSAYAIFSGFEEWPEGNAVRSNLGFFHSAFIVGYCETIDGRQIVASALKYLPFYIQKKRKHLSILAKSVMIVMRKYLDVVFGCDQQILQYMLACLIMLREECDESNEVRGFLRDLMSISPVRDIALPKPLLLRIQSVIEEGV
jgi:hypothetical protein